MSLSAEGKRWSSRGVHWPPHQAYTVAQVLKIVRRRPMHQKRLRMLRPHFLLNFPTRRQNPYWTALARRSQIRISGIETGLRDIYLLNKSYVK